MSSGENSSPQTSREGGVPWSLFNPGGVTAASRRIIKAATVANGVPVAATPGFATRGHRFIVGTIKLTGGTGITYSVWIKSLVSDEWCLDTRLGTNGVVTLLTADPDNPQIFILEIVGIDRAYLELASVTGATIDAWLGGVSF